MKRAKYRITTNLLEDEKWKQIVIDGDPINYAVNRKGEVKNIKTGSRKKQYLIRNRSCSYTPIGFSLRYKKRYIQILKKRLIACAFVPIPKKYKNIDQLELETYFKNGDCDDYRIENIGWYYPLDNSMESKELPHWRTLSKRQVDEVVDLLKSGKYNAVDISKITGIAPYSIHNIKSLDKSSPYNYITNGFDFGRLPNGTIDDRTIIHICELLSTTDYPIHELAKIYGLDYHLVVSIYKRKSHSDITDRYSWKMDKLERSRLSRVNVQKICKLLQDDEFSIPEIAMMIEAPIRSVSNIYKRKTYTDISKDYKW